jgi:hypothetical protein
MLRRPERSGPLPDMGMHGAGYSTITTISVEALVSAFVVPVSTPLDHRWELRVEEFEDGHSYRRFECVECGAVRYE